MDRANLAKYRFQIGRGGEGGQDASADEERRASYQMRTFDGQLTRPTPRPRPARCFWFAWFAWFGGLLGLVVSRSWSVVGRR